MILVIDDDRAVRISVQVELEDGGHKVHSVASGEDALQFLKGGAIVSLILSDYNMPGGMNGIELGRQVRALRLEMPLVLMTGEPTPQLLDEAESAGFVEVLTKPTSQGDLLRLISILLS